MPYAETNAGKLFYAVSRGAADGPALVLVHGAGGTRLNWPADLRRLGPRATVYTLDLPGHGRSGGRGRDAIGGYAETVIAFLSAVDIERAVIAGHSMGGAIAQTLALEYAGHKRSDARLAGLMLVATGARLRVAPAILEGIGSDFAGAVDLITRFAWSPEADPAMVEQGKKLLAQTDPDVLFGDFLACDRFDVMERLGEIEIPTLIVTGAADRLTPPKYARYLAEHIPDARLTLVEGAGHMVMLERPTEVAQAARSFLETKLPEREGST